MKKKVFKFFLVITIISLLGLWIFYSSNNHLSYASPSDTSTGSPINNPSKTSQNFKILVMEINPILTSVTNTSLYPNNNGHPKASEYFHGVGEEDRALNEIVNDIKYISNNYLNVSVQREYINDFVLYNKQITLKNGTKAYKLDEETMIDMSGTAGQDKGNWYNLITSPMANYIGSYQFNYDDFILKHNLVARKNNGEFDMVILLTHDPSSTYETIMVGKTPFWINGPSEKRDCSNFILANVSISRRDANLHALLHAMENIMRKAFRLSNKLDYTADAFNINSKNDLKTLNLWYRFALSDYSNSGSVMGVGNVHFPANGVSDYDYSNTNKVLSEWNSWQNYPNLLASPVYADKYTWINGESAKLSAYDNKDPDRLYCRWFSNLMPHVTGHYSTGHLNNWWKYFYSLDFVKSLTNNDNLSKNVYVGDAINVNVNVNYNSGYTYNFGVIKTDDNIIISNRGVVNYDRNGNLVAVGKGTSTVTIYYDGLSLSYNVNVSEKPINSISIIEKPYKLTYVEGEYFSTLGLLIRINYSDGTTRDTDAYDYDLKRPLTLSDKSVNILYSDKKVSLAIKVIKKSDAPPPSNNIPSSGSSSGTIGGGSGTIGGSSGTIGGGSGTIGTGGEEKPKEEKKQEEPKKEVIKKEEPKEKETEDKTYTPYIIIGTGFSLVLVGIAILNKYNLLK